MKSKGATFFGAYFILFLDTFELAFLLPLFPLIFLDPNVSLLPRDTLEVTRHFLLGVVLVANPLAQFFGAPFFGQLSDRLGRKKTLYWTLSGTAIGHALSAIALMTSAYTLLLAARLFTGFFSATLAISMALIADFSPTKSERCRTIGFVAATIGLSWLLALIMEHFQVFNPAVFFWSMALLSCINLIVLTLFCRERATPTKNGNQTLLGVRALLHLLQSKQLRLLYTVLFFWGLGYIVSLQWSSVLSLVKFQATDVQIDRFFVIWAAFWTLSGALFAPLLAKKISLWPLTLWSLFLLGLFLFDSGVADFFLYYTIASVLGGIFGAITWTTTISLISLSAKNEQQGIAFGVMEGTFALGHFFAPILGGIVAGFSFEPLLFACSLAVFVAFVFLLVYVVRRKSRLAKL